MGVSPFSFFGLIEPWSGLRPSPARTSLATRYVQRRALRSRSLSPGVSPAVSLPSGGLLALVSLLYVRTSRAFGSLFLAFGVRVYGLLLLAPSGARSEVFLSLDSRGLTRRPHSESAAPRLGLCFLVLSASDALVACWRDLWLPASGALVARRRGLGWLIRSGRPGNAPGELWVLGVGPLSLWAFSTPGFPA